MKVTVKRITALVSRTMRKTSSAILLWPPKAERDARLEEACQARLDAERRLTETRAAIDAQPTAAVAAVAKMAEALAPVPAQNARSGGAR
jgi:hypothetical protein